MSTRMLLGFLQNFNETFFRTIHRYFDTAFCPLLAFQGQFCVPKWVRFVIVILVIKFLHMVKIITTCFRREFRNHLKYSQIPIFVILTGEVYMLTTDFPSTEADTGAFYRIMDPRR